MGRGFSVNRDDNVRAHFLDDVDRQIVQEPAVRPNAIFFCNWSPDRWQRHGCPHRLAERSAFKDVLLAGGEIRSYAAKGDGKVVKAFQIGIGESDAINQVRNPLARTLKPGLSMKLLADRNF